MRRDVQALQGLDHPNIVRTDFSCATALPLSFLVMCLSSFVTYVIRLCHGIVCVESRNKVLHPL